MNTELMSVNHIVSTQKYCINFRWVCRCLIQNKLPRKFKVVVNKEIKTHLFFWKIFLWPVNIARTLFLIRSVQFSQSFVSDSLRPHELQHTTRFDARCWMLGAGPLGRPRGMVWGGRREEGSGWGTHVYLWRIHFDIWQN